MPIPDHLSNPERRTLQQTIQTLNEKFGSEVRFIALFGSKARGDFGPDSDSDILVISENDDRHTREQIRAPIYDFDIENNTFTAVWVIGWERFQTLAIRRPGLYANLCHDTLELWRRPDTDNPFEQPEPALA